MIEAQKSKSFNGYLLKPVEKLFLSSNGLEFVKDWEAIQRVAYDTDGAGYCTIGYGHLLYKRECDGTHDLEKQFHDDHLMTEADALLLLEKDVALATGYVRKWIKGAMVTQTMFDALVSLTFNAGGNGGKWKVYEYTRDGKYRDAAKEFENINKARMVVIDENGNKEVKLVEIYGLTRRRNAEIDVYLNGNYVAP